jgi:uncharacterized protein (DUF2461 family)
MHHTQSPFVVHRVIKLRNKIKREETQTEEERDGEDESEKSKFVPCPICNSSVSKASINSHIDACLRSNDSKLTQKGAFYLSITYQGLFLQQLLFQGKLNWILIIESMFQYLILQMTL